MTSSSDLQVNESAENEIIIPEGEFWSNEPPLESNLHLRQMFLLIECLEWVWQDREDYFASGNLTIYYSTKQKKPEEFRGPDFFVALGTTKNEKRKSWVVWKEGGKYPNVVIELLSEITAEIDKGEKKQIYQDIFRIINYFWFDPESLELKGFRLVGGKYQEIEANAQGWLWSQQLELYLGVVQQQLRYFTAEGKLILTPFELAVQEKQRADKLAAKLRELGIDPESLI